MNISQLTAYYNRKLSLSGYPIVTLGPASKPWLEKRRKEALYLYSPCAAIIFVYRNRM